MSRSPSFFFYILVFLAEILLFGVLILSLVWVYVHRNGFAWATEDNNSDEIIKQHFNLHPVLMITGFIFLMGHSILVYRLFSCCNKMAAKILHTVLHLMAVPCIVVATIAAFDSHNLRTDPIPNLYSLHSWLGCLTIGLFGVQLIAGLFTFWMLVMCDNATASFRASILPIHSAFGVITFMLAVATCVTGFTEKAIFELKTDYRNLEDEALYINAMGISLGVLVILIGYLLHNPKYGPMSPVAFVDNAPSNSHYVMTQQSYVFKER